MRCGVWEKQHEKHLSIPRKFRRWNAKYMERVRFHDKDQVRLIPGRSMANRARSEDTDLSWVMNNISANTPRFPAMEYMMDLCEDEEGVVDYYDEMDNVYEQADAESDGFVLGRYVEEEECDGDVIDELLALMSSKHA